MAAGLGFKTFTTGEVLTAADTNGYLMQGVLVFASAAARDAAITSPQEGQCCYLKDTDAVLTYSGSAWVGFDDSNAVQNSIVDAKGDLIAASAADTPARLAVGNNGETLVADSSTATGLAWAGNYAAGKNLVMNSNFNISQRGTTFAAVVNDYTMDRFNARNSSLGVFTVSQDTDAPAGFKTSAKWLCTTADASPAAADFALYRQYFEGQALQILKKGSASAVSTTLSFWVKSNLTGTFIANLRDEENNRTISKSYTISAAGTWEKKTINFAGDTTGALSNDSTGRFTVNWFLGVGSDRSSGTLGTTWATSVTANAAVGQTNVASAINNYWQITGVQWEIGNTATEWQLMTGTIQGELAACQRYFQVIGGTTSQPIVQSYTAANAFNQTPQNFPVQMRVAPTATKSGTWAVGNTGQPSAANLSVFGYSLQTQKDGTLGTFYFYPDSADDTITFSAEL